MKAGAERRRRLRPQERLALEVEARPAPGARAHHRPAGDLLGRRRAGAPISGCVKAKESFDFLSAATVDLSRRTRRFLPQLGSDRASLGTVQIRSLPYDPGTRRRWGDAAVDIVGFNRYLLDCIHRDAGACRIAGYAWRSHRRALAPISSMELLTSPNGERKKGNSVLPPLLSRSCCR